MKPLAMEEWHMVLYRPVGGVEKVPEVRQKKGWLRRRVEALASNDKSALDLPQLGKIQTSAPRTAPRCKGVGLSKADLDKLGLPQGESSTMDETDLGPSGSLVVEQWLTGRSSARALSVWMADQLGVLFPMNGRDKEPVDPLGTLVGGVSEAHGEWLFTSLLYKGRSKVVAEAVSAFTPPQGPRAPQCLTVEQVNHMFRRQLLEKYPNRPGGGAQECLRLQVLMEVLRVGKALCEGVAVDASHQPLNDSALLVELSLSTQDLTSDCLRLSPDKACTEQLEKFNSMVDDYLLRLMRFKAATAEQLGRMRENSSFGLLGLDASASEADVKRAYKQLAVHLHPDKGGDKGLFQELQGAYDRVMSKVKERDGRGQAKNNKWGEVFKENEPPSEPRTADTAKQPDPTQAEGEGDKAAAKCEVEALLERSAKALKEAEDYAAKAADMAGDADARAEEATALLNQTQGPVVSGVMTNSIHNSIHTSIYAALTIAKSVKLSGYFVIDVATVSLEVSKAVNSPSQCATSAASSLTEGFTAVTASSDCEKVVGEATALFRKACEELSGGLGRILTYSEAMNIAQVPPYPPPNPSDSLSLPP